MEESLATIPWQQTERVSALVGDIGCDFASFIAPDGYRQTYPILKADDGVRALAFDEQGHLLFTRQWRPITGQVETELPGGGLTCDNPVEDARRELLEETGYKAGEGIVLGCWTAIPGLVDVRNTVVLFPDLAEGGHQQSKEPVEVITIPWAQAYDMASTGQLDMMCSLALFAADRYLRNRSH